MDKPVILSSQPIFSGRIFSVRRDRIRMADGRDATLDVVSHPGSVAILASPSPGTVVLVRQYRYAVGAWLWEIPAGTVEPDESTAAGALRELAEETGYRAARAREIASFYATPGFCDEKMHVYVAEELAQGPQSLDPDEAIEVRVVTFDEARELVARGEIADGKTLVALAYLDAL